MAGGSANKIYNWLLEYGLKPFAIAMVFVLVALLWTFPMQRYIAYPFLFLFFGAVMGSAWFGGFIAGAWAIVMSSIVIAYFFMAPLYSIAVSRELMSYFSAFIVCAIAITVISAARRRSEDSSRAVREQLEVRVRERTAELEKTSLEILERERQLRLLTEAIPQQIWRATRGGEIEYCNHDLVEFTGKTADELQGANFFHIFHPSDLHWFRQSWDKARSLGRAFEIEARVQDADRDFRWFLIRGIPQHTASGEIACWYGVNIDIEERYRAEQDLRVAQRDSARWSRTLSMAEMAAFIAHEIKQPLTALITHAHVCRRWLHAEPANAEKATHAAENLVLESTRVSTVIDRVRSLFTEKDIVREPTDLNLVVVDEVRLLRDEAIRRGISIRLELAPQLPKIRVDPVQVQQVFHNLVMNGMESTMATGRARELTISSELIQTGQIIITVNDNGVGMTEEVRRQMFEPFFTTKPEGTGIGLSICRSIVEAHDGRIWADSLDQGTAFHVSLGPGE